MRLRTLSKAHGIAGLRVGYAIVEPKTLAVMMKVRIHYVVSTLSQDAAEIVLRITAVEDALVPGRLAILEEALRQA